MNSRGIIVWCASLCCGLTSVLAEDNVDFQRAIRPLLSEYCFQCHGPDEAQRKGGVRFDLTEDAFEPGDSGERPFVPGQPAHSEVLRRVLSTDPQEQMPPPSTGKRLTAEQAELLRRWIQAGAKSQGHWAFETPRRPAIPTVKHSTWPQTPLDNFILAKLEAEGLSPNPAAEKTTLIRRVSLDLTGLPPTPAEVAAFLADASPQAYERVVDRLLASPHYGERMAMQWLDYARYADSNGFQVDSSRQMWPWRDWVIEAYNRNMPFDQFTVEQLAGDLLPNPTTSQLVATGFNRNHRITGEGGSIAEEWRIETVIDRVETTGTTWLGLTFNCCRCHDHKYDPISQKEFYQFYAFFNNVPESGLLAGEAQNTPPLISVPTSEQQARQQQLQTALESARKRVQELEPQLPALVAAWEPGFQKELAADRPTWQGLKPTSVKSLGGATLTAQPDGTYLASGPNPNFDTYEIKAPLAAGTFSGLRLEALPDPQLPNQSLGRYSNGNYVLSAVELEITAPSLSEPLRGVVQKVAADYSQSGWDIQLLLDNNPANGWAIDGPTKRDPRTAMFLLEAPLAVPEQAQLTVRLKHTAIQGHNIGRFRLATTGLPPSAVQLEGARFPESLRTILATESPQRTPEQIAELTRYFRSNVDNPVLQADQAVTHAQQALAAIEKNYPTVMVMQEMALPRPAMILVRGQYDRPGDAVTAGLPAALPPLPAGQPMNRLGLARWIVDPQHPLTSRVWVNRTWETFFGTGLVKTTENFGSQAEWPSHPELLDWLATEFIRLNWDMKAFQKQIVLSATYQQSTTISPEKLQRDPENRWLSRGPRFRLSAELVRDQALAVSGLYVPQVGGPSVRPYMPDGVWDETSRYGDLRGYKPDTGPGLYRRSLYTVWKRTAAPPTMLLFDAPSREICTVKRSRTNTPLQALVLMNEVTYVEVARGLAQRALREGGSTPESRLAFAFQTVFARPPQPAELQLLISGFKTDLERFQGEPTAALQLLQIGELPLANDVAPTELAAYTVTASLLLNLDEFVTRE